MGSRPEARRYAGGPRRTAGPGRDEMAFAERILGVVHEARLSGHCETLLREPRLA